MRSNQVQECDQKLKLYLASLPTRVPDQPAPCPDAPESPAQKRKRAKKPRGNQPSMDMKAERQRICGADLTSIDGINVMTACPVVSEAGTDMRRFPDEDHFVSWMGLTPSHDIPGGKIIRSSKKKVKNRVAGALRTAATGLLNSQTYVGARYRHFRRNLKTYKSAVKAMAHELALPIYRLLTKGQAWVDRGAAHFERRSGERELANLHSKAMAKG